MSQAKADSLDGAEVKRLAGGLNEALSFLRRFERTQDYFSGYSLSEVLQERITDIGDPDNEEVPSKDYDDKVSVRVRGWSTGNTKLSEINRIRLELLGEDGKSGIIGQAIELVSAAGDDGVFFRKVRESQSEGSTPP